MKQLILVPEGWPCTLRECPPGNFVLNDQLCFKTEYGAFKSVGDTKVPGDQIKWTVTHDVDAYNSAGEHMGVKEDEMVQPVIATWEESEGWH